MSLFDTAMNAAKSAYASWNAPSSADAAKAKAAAAEAAARQSREQQARSEALERMHGMMEQAREKRQADWAERTRDIETVLPELAGVQTVNDGDPPIDFSRDNMDKWPGLEFKTKGQGEDRKLRDSKSGLYAVADGVSTGRGDTAAEVATRRLQKDLGADFDRQIENIRATAPQSLDRFVMDGIRAAVARADQDVKTIQESGITDAEGKERYDGTNATLSALKIVDLPNGGKRAFLTNVGDSRIALKRGGELHRLTTDDGLFDMRIEQLRQKGEITAEQAKRYETGSKDDIDHPAILNLYKARNVITEGIGGGVKAGDLVIADDYLVTDPAKAREAKSQIIAIDLRPGDVLVLTSDGDHDVTDDAGKLKILNNPNLDARGKERALQEYARERSTDKNNKRSKGGDDITDIVVDPFEAPRIGESRAESAPKAPEQKQEKRAYTPEQAKAWPGELKQIDAEIRDVDQEIADLQRRGDAVELAKAERDRNALEQQRAQYEYWIARSSADSVADRLSSHAGERPDQAQPRVGDVIRHRREIADGVHQLIEARVTGANPDRQTITVQFESKNDRGEPVMNVIDVDADDLTDSLNVDLNRGLKAQLEMPKKLAALEKLKQEAVALRQGVERAQTAQALEAQRAKMGLPVESRGRWAKVDRSRREEPATAQSERRAPASAAEAALQEAYDALTDTHAKNVREAKTMLTGDPVADIGPNRDSYRLSRMEALNRAASGPEKDAEINRMMEEFNVEQSWEQEDVSDDEADILIRYYKAKQALAQEKERLALGSSVPLSKEDQRKILLARSTAGETEKVLRMLPGPERARKATEVLVRLKARG